MTLLTNSEIPNSITIDNKQYIVIGLMDNYHYRALLMPIGGGSPGWFSNAELKQILNK